ncbi:tetratricopeptide repeat protein [Actinacidiphila epipremni]|uniref:Tetratricopeptide repeat protein n=1 Tax=Actinacidiphila epipremni TaxID=2053013 RepID=A0ABX0ZWB2_9ACTN|nr:tetratricopeptide repeat protein [Actinacidiphila epipremni]NJP45989.1 tetratricopeptide repeat protein [Actinacidiphila epipremni]
MDQAPIHEPEPTAGGDTLPAAETAPRNATRNAVSGATVSGPVVQAGSVTGGIHLHEYRTQGPPHASASPVPRQLIPPPAHFTDRVADLVALDALRSAGGGSGAPLVVVTGAAGVGKTALAVTWLHHGVGDYPDGQLYVDLRGHADDGDPVPPDAVLGRFLRGFGVDRLPAELAEMAALWRTVTAGLRVAVLLDNALSAAQVLPLVPASPGSLVVVTSRNRLPGLGVHGARFHHLDVLPPAATVELLGRRLGEERAAREEEAVASIARLCAGLPLAVCVAAARIAARPRQSLTAFVAAMSRDGDRLASLRAGRDLAVQTVLDGAYGALAVDVAAGYRQLGLLPVTDFGAGIAAAACDLPSAAARELVDELVDVSLLEELGPDRYRFHDLIRLHAAQRAAAEDTEAVRATTVRRALDWYLWTATEARALLAPAHVRLRRDYVRIPEEEPPFDSPAGALAWLDAERLHLMAAVHTAIGFGFDDTAWQIVDSMQPLWVRLRPAEMWVEAHRLGLAAADRAGRPTAVMQMLTTGGGGLCNAGLFDEAAQWFGRALSLGEETGDRRAQSQALHGLGQAHQFGGRPESAAAYYRHALALREAIGYTRGAALSRLSLGQLALDAGSPREAVDLLTRARADLLAVPDPYDAARALAFLGVAHATGPEADIALSEWELGQALSELDACGAVGWQARVLEMQGVNAEERGDYGRARDCYRQSLARYGPISPRDAHRLGERLRGLDER